MRIRSTVSRAGAGLLPSSRSAAGPRLRSCGPSPAA